MKKILVCILSVLMVLALAAPVSAEDTDNVETYSDSVCEAALVTSDSGSECYETLGEAIDEANRRADSLEAVTVSLYQDFDLSKRAPETSGESVSLFTLHDGVTLTSANGQVTLNYGDNGYESNIITLLGSASVSNIDFDIPVGSNAKYAIQAYNGNGSVTNVTINDGSAKYAGILVNGAQLTVDNVNYNDITKKQGSNYAAIEIAKGKSASYPKLNVDGPVYVSVYADGKNMSSVYVDINQITDSDVNKLIAIDSDVVDGELVNGLKIENGHVTKVSAEDNEVLLGAVYYKDLESALTAASSSSAKTIKLVNDVEVDKMLEVNVEGLTIDLDGRKISASASFGGVNNANHLVNISANNVTIKNGTLVAVEGSETKHIVNVYQAEDVNLEDLVLDRSGSGIGGALIVVNASSVTVSGNLDLKAGTKKDSQGIPYTWYGINVDSKNGTASLEFVGSPTVTLEGETREAYLVKVENNGTATGDISGFEKDAEGNYVVKKTTPGTGGNTSGNRPTYRPSSPSKDLPSNTKECQKEFGDEYIWSDEYDACVIKFMIVDTATR